MREFRPKPITFQPPQEQKPEEKEIQESDFRITYEETNQPYKEGSKEYRPNIRFGSGRA